MILPFKAWFYNQDAISTMADVITPPYDVIATELQDDLLSRHAYNFCHLDLPRETGDARYEVAGRIMQDWQNEKVLVQDSKPSLYLHRHTFHLPDGRKVARKGFFAACQIEDFSSGKILPHEKTLDAPKLDRLNMTRATATNLSPVFSLYSDPVKSIEEFCHKILQATPFLDFVSDEGERHEVWKIQDPSIIDKINAELGSKPFFIADGHHRYETALTYRNEILANHPELADHAAPRFILMYFCNINDEGLVILPIHRCLKNLPNFVPEDFLQKLKGQFEVQEYAADNLFAALTQQQQISQTHHAFVMVAGNHEFVYLVAISHEQWQTLAQARGLNLTLADLDVTVLHNEIFQNLLQISEEDLAKQTYLVYEKSAEGALFNLHNGDSQVAFLLNSTKIEQMQNVAEAGLKMPQKSTFFYPKIISGLILHSVATHIVDGLEH